MSWQEDLSTDFSMQPAQIAQFEKLLELLLNASDRNLTAVTDPQNIVNVHFRDSLSLLAIPEVRRSAAAVDVGSGAGFPGLPLAIARPDLSMSMIEATKKKCDFINMAIAALALDNASALAVRAEEAGRAEMRDASDVSFARAVGPVSLVLEYCLPLVRVGGSAILQRGAGEASDEDSASHAAALLGARLVRIEPYGPYRGAKNLHIWVFLKTAPTPERFPRRPGAARKKPLGGS